MELAFKLGLIKSIGFVLVKDRGEQTIVAKPRRWESTKYMGEILLITTLVGCEDPVVR